MKASLLLLHILCVIAIYSATEYGADFEFPEDALISDEVHYGFNIGANNERQTSKVTIRQEKKALDAIVYNNKSKIFSHTNRFFEEGCAVRINIHFILYYVVMS